MKRTNFYKTILPLLSVMVLVACSTEPVLFDKSSFFVAFNTSTSQVEEDADTLLIPIDVAAFKGSKALTVTVEVMVDTDSTAAVEGVDFTLVSKTIRFPDGMGTGYVQVVPINNDDFEGNKFFRLNLVSNSANYAFGVIQENRVTLVDDEHPLKLVLGDYVFAGMNYWDEPFSLSIKTQAVEGDLTQVQFPLADLIGYAAPANDMVVASVDMTARTFKIKTGQSYKDFGIGECKIIGIDAGDKDMPDGSFVTGTIDENGNITMNENIGVVITSGAYKGGLLCVYGIGSVWTKQ